MKTYRESPDDLDMAVRALRDAILAALPRLTLVQYAALLGFCAGFLLAIGLVAIFGVR